MLFKNYALGGAVALSLGMCANVALAQNVDAEIPVTVDESPQRPQADTVSDTDSTAIRSTTSQQDDEPTESQIADGVSPASPNAVVDDGLDGGFTEEEIAALVLPDMAFEETSRITDNYKKYFYFHRTDTVFDEAFADIAECDAMASGFSFHARGNANIYVYQYGLGGAIGGAIGSAIADAIFGSAERRKSRRINMRRCMGYKGYQRYGMEKERWQAFHFEEGNATVKGEKRKRYLMQQAKVASGPKPTSKVLVP